MECEPLFAESDLEDDGEVVEMEQDVILSEQTSYTLTPPYTLTLDTWQFQQSGQQPSDINGPSTSGGGPCENQGSDVLTASTVVINENVSSGSEQFEPSDDATRICSPSFSSNGMMTFKDPMLARYVFCFITCKQN